MDKPQTPPLRFKGFDGDWEEKKLKEVLTIKSGFSQKEIEVSGGIYPILATGGEIGRTNTALYDKESVLIGRKGTIDKPYYMNTPFWTVDTLFYSELKSNIDGKFLYFLFQCIEWRKLDTSTGVPSLTSTTIHEIQKYFPQLPEQTQIGDFFRQLDQQIAQARAEWEKSIQLKKAMLAKMFPVSGSLKPEIRFNGFSGDWERKKLGEVGYFYSGGTPSVGNAKFYGGEIPFVRSGEIHCSSTELFLTQEGLNNSSAKLVKKGDILFALYGATSGEVGRSQINGAINQAILAIVPNEVYDPEFIAQWLKGNKENIVNLYLQGGQGNLSAEIVKKIEIKFPRTQKEQTQIGNFFRQLDKTIALQAAELEKLNQLKKGLLSVMLV
ncbi:hypothetical protein PL75_01980 [Neisseria arctica]|uniref:Type I restriction modification DNA specificity domain-containing protein n=1 Tax=Neisseria arctica TaxID=1470200 RepID=A0A0J0YUE2_9NEIS|nr:restriction endonuclease subunit S [Neisseria arctica]KLT73731.1 hypothetical protein PL75_01980 [Neisseria arctica]UOO85869.1 restriction endonuclease subunit S [Neisseria arctica]